MPVLGSTVSNVPVTGQNIHDLESCIHEQWKEARMNLSLLLSCRNQWPSLSRLFSAGRDAVLQYQDKSNYILRVTGLQRTLSCTLRIPDQSVGRVINTSASTWTWSLIHPFPHKCHLMSAILLTKTNGYLTLDPHRNRRVWCPHCEGSGEAVLRISALKKLHYQKRKHIKALTIASAENEAVEVSTALLLKSLCWLLLSFESDHLMRCLKTLRRRLSNCGCREQLWQRRLDLRRQEFYLSA